MSIFVSYYEEIGHPKKASFQVSNNPPQLLYDTVTTPSCSRGEGIVAQSLYNDSR
jgi:hypothetical protein